MFSLFHIWNRIEASRQPAVVPLAVVIVIVALRLLQGG